jgi:four helix bundle protein
MPHNFKNLIAWKKAMSLSRAVCQATSSFPVEECFGLTAQMRRASVSIPSNIAEGCRRGTSKDFRRFLQTALGSGAELETQVLLANDLGLLKSPDDTSLINDINEVMRILGGLEKAVNDRIHK